MNIGMICGTNIIIVEDYKIMKSKDEILVYLQLSNSPDIESQKELAEVLYSISEYGLWPDYVDSVSTEQCVLCWNIINHIMTR